MSRPPPTGAALAGALLAALVQLAAARPAAAEIERFAVLIGNNTGQGDEPDLRYAESDAERMSEVLLDLGGFRGENVVLLRGRGSPDARRALADLERRIAAAAGDALLLVYYSGHADATALHLGGDRLVLDELERLVRGSAARVRLLLVDSCRSGALTRRKGGQLTRGFSIDLDEVLAAQGVIVLTSSSATEDAQESDELRGSFFTHYLVSGLMGAADLGADGVVTLAEAYRYAYESTLRASSRTIAGVQHATFHYDLSGQGELPLTRLGGLPGQRAWIRFPRERSYLLLRDDAAGAVVAEVGLRDARRRISVRPGRYFVRGRGRDHLLEGTVRVAAGEERAVVDAELRRIAFARLVRKGGGVLDRAHGPEAGARARSALDNADRACLGGFAGYALQIPAAALGARLGWCRSGYDNDAIESSVDEIDLELRAGKALDLPLVTVTPLISLGGGIFRQRFDTRGQALAARTTAMGHVAAGLAVSAELGGGLYAVLEAAAETYFFRQDGAAGPTADFAVAISAGLGWFL